MTSPAEKSSAVCTECGASYPAAKNRCPYCNSPAGGTSGGHVIDDTMKYISGLEKSLLSHKDDNDTATVISFIAAICMFIASAVLFYKTIAGMILPWLAIGFSFMFFFILFGLAVTFNEKRAYNRAFKNLLKTEIDLYIKEKEMSVLLFKRIVRENLDTKSPLFQYLDKL